MDPSMLPRYAIIGGGIAGLTLAIGLHKRGVNVTIYEQAPKFGEIGAGVAFTSNAVQAMQILDSGVHAAFDKVATRNGWESKQNVWFDFLDGTAGAEGIDPNDQEALKKAAGHQESLFVLKSKVGTNGVHRAKFLDEMVHLIPKGMAKFKKHLDTLEIQDDGKVLMKFHDGTSETADAVIGCDGIKSVVRKWLVDGGPESEKAYTYKYAYRGLIPMEKAVEAIGEERARNGCMWMGPDRHVLTFAVDHGSTLNLVGFVSTNKDWPDPSKSTLPAKREEAIKDYQGFGPNVMALLNLCKPELDVWSIFDLGKHPLKQYNKGRVCVLGDAASATSPHHGAGAGMCIESAAVLASLLAEPMVTGEPCTIEAAFQAYSNVRRLRTQWLVNHSRRTGDMYEWRVADVGRNYDKIQQELTATNAYVEGVDVQVLCDEAVEEMKSCLVDLYGS